MDVTTIKKLCSSFSTSCRKKHSPLQSFSINTQTIVHKQQQVNEQIKAQRHFIKQISINFIERFPSNKVVCCIVATTPSLQSAEVIIYIKHIFNEFHTKIHAHFFVYLPYVPQRYYQVHSSQPFWLLRQNILACVVRRCLNFGFLRSPTPPNNFFNG